MIIALAGRRIDAEGAPARFPGKNVDVVRAEIRDLLLARRAAVLVCSAACGADLLALEVAGELGLRRRVVLPFEPAHFRRTSVTDRPGAWGERFDRVIEQLGQADVVILAHRGAGDDAYRATNHAILDQAVALGSREGDPVLAVIVWEGQPRGEDDLTAEFAAEARARFIEVVELITLGRGDRTP